MTRGSRFLQGHDAKLKAALIRSALSGSKRATQKLESLGWTKFLEAKRAGLPDIPRPRRGRRASKQEVSGDEAAHAAAEPYRVVLSDVDETGIPSALSVVGEG